MEDLLDSLFSDLTATGSQILNFGITWAVIILAFIAFGFLLWHIRCLRDDCEFTLTRESISEQCEKIRTLLTSMKANKREVTYALLLIEEIVVRLHENAGQAVSLRVRHFFGDVSISLSARGEAYNPFESVESWNTESEDYLRDLIFRAHKLNLGYSRRNGRNVVLVRVHRATSHSMYITFTAMLIGIACGFGMKFLPAGVASFIAGGVLSTVQSLFLNAISLLLAPLVFFSLSSGLSKLSGGSEIGRIGGKVLASYLVTTVISILIGFGISFLFFSGSVPSLPENLAALPEGMQQSADVSVSSLLLGIIPRNMLSPILEGNMLQVIFIAVLTGLALSALGDKTAALRSIFDEANSLMLKMMEMIISFMPTVAFAAMALLVFSYDLATLAVLAKYLILIIIGGIALLLLYSAIIIIFGRISPLAYIRKACVYMLTPFMIPSSSACIPLTIDFCKKKLGVSNKIASFSIPLGASINMNGIAMSVILTVILLARMCGIELDFGTCVKIGVLTLLLAIGAPGVPNSGLVVVATLLVAGGIPVGALGFVVGIWNIVDRLQTSLNVNGDIATCVVVAKSENELDESLYSE
ncbi:dicarboxylate/amino acid:cation symporter [Treponema ruminis]|uniref:Na+/H+-dicarboxylate symporter n=1 Tax=Treponema ruminis TaxID=744515 RepID=A0A7W8LLB8_9SPIR|nr:dicarboxylate/amino acid:cation symporter [Treponema ruminis]MBB5225332.1 Na+/H+-dicarboxylate symporter [Treponema ruminis]QSI01797.1 dicarboxylate/amino acid:cation symporter [Treponema ruminis]